MRITSTCRWLLTAGDVPEAQMVVSGGASADFDASDPVDRYNGVALMSGEILIGVLSRKKNSDSNIKRISSPWEPMGSQKAGTAPGWQRQWSRPIGFDAASSDFRDALQLIPAVGLTEGTSVRNQQANQKKVSRILVESVKWQPGGQDNAWSVLFVNTSYGYLDDEYWFAGHTGGNIGYEHPWMRDLQIYTGGGGNFYGDSTGKGKIVSSSHGVCMKDTPGNKYSGGKSTTTGQGASSENFASNALRDTYERTPAYNIVGNVCPLMGTAAFAMLCTDYSHKPQCTDILLRESMRPMPGNSIYGYFTLRTQAGISADTRSNTEAHVGYAATASQMKSALDHIGEEYAPVSVSRVGPDANNGFTWTITFSDPVPTLSVSTDDLKTSSSFCCNGPDDNTDNTDYRSWDPISNGNYNRWDKKVDVSGNPTAYAWQDKCLHGNYPDQIFGATEGGHCSVPDAVYCKGNLAEPSLPDRPPDNSKQGAVAGNERRCPYGYAMSPGGRAISGLPRAAPTATMASVLVHGIYTGKRVEPRDVGRIAGGCETDSECVDAGLCNAGMPSVLCQCYRGTCVDFSCETDVQCRQATDGHRPGDLCKGGDDQCRCLDNRCIDYSQHATVVRYPDAFDCGLKRSLCYKNSLLPDRYTAPNEMPAEAIKMDGNDGTCIPANTVKCVDYPLRDSLEQGKAFSIPAGQGWGDDPRTDESTYEFFDEVEVRAQIWSQTSAPTFLTEWKQGQLGGGQALYKSFHHGISVLPEKVKVVTRIESGIHWNAEEKLIANHGEWLGGNNEGGKYMWDGTGSAQRQGRLKYKRYGGVVYQYDKNNIGVYAPFRSNEVFRSEPSTANVMTIGDGWGTGLGKFGYHIETTMHMKVIMWRYNQLVERDAASIRITVMDANEPPVPKVYAAMIQEETPKDEYTCYTFCQDDIRSAYRDGLVNAWDPEGKDSTLSYSFIGGNPNGALRLESDDGIGAMFVENRSEVNYETNPFFQLELLITDEDGGEMSSTIALETRDKNDLPRFCESECRPSMTGSDRPDRDRWDGIKCSQSKLDSNGCANLNPEGTFGWGASGGCQPARPETHQPLKCIQDDDSHCNPPIYRRISEFGRVGEYALQGNCIDAPKQKPSPQYASECGALCGTDDDILTSAQSIYFKYHSTLYPGSDTTAKYGWGTKQTLPIDPKAVWRVNFCSGLIMMAQAGKLDFEGIDAPTHYDLEVYLYDDHKDTKPFTDPLFNLTAAWAIVRVQANDGNDPPVWPETKPIVYVDENTDGAAAVVQTGPMPLGKPIEKVMWEQLKHILDVDRNDTLIWELTSAKMIQMIATNPCGTRSEDEFIAAGKNAFLIGNTTGQLMGGGLKTDYECGVKYEIMLSVTDTGTDTNGVAGGLFTPDTRELSDMGAIEVQVNDLNDPPFFYTWDGTDNECTADLPTPCDIAYTGVTMPLLCKSGTLCRTMKENAAFGDIGSSPVVGIDLDANRMAGLNGHLTFSSEDSMFNVFANGTVSLKDGSADLDYESTAHTCFSVPNAAGGDPHTIYACYRVAVTVTDDGMLAERSCTLANPTAEKQKFAKSPHDPSSGEIPETTPEDWVTWSETGEVAVEEEIEFTCCADAHTGHFNFSTDQGFIEVGSNHNIDQFVGSLTGHLEIMAGDRVPFGTGAKGLFCAPGDSPCGSNDYTTDPAIMVSVNGGAFVTADTLSGTRVCRGGIPAADASCGETTTLKLLKFPGSQGTPQVRTANGIAVEVYRKRTGVRYYEFCGDCDCAEDTRDAGRCGIGSCFCTEVPVEYGRTAMQEQTSKHVCENFLGGEWGHSYATPKSTVSELLLVLENVNEPPVIDPGMLIAKVPENSPSGFSLGTLQSEDPDNQRTGLVESGGVLQRPYFYAAALTSTVGGTEIWGRPARDTMIEDEKWSCWARVCVHVDTGQVKLSSRVSDDESTDEAEPRLPVDYEALDGGAFNVRFYVHDDACSNLDVATTADCGSVFLHSFQIQDRNDRPDFCAGEFVGDPVHDMGFDTNCAEYRISENFEAYMVVDDCNKYVHGRCRRTCDSNDVEGTDDCCSDGSCTATEINCGAQCTNGDESADSSGKPCCNVRDHEAAIRPVTLYDENRAHGCPGNYPGYPGSITEENRDSIGLEEYYIKCSDKEDGLPLMDQDNEDTILLTVYDASTCGTISATMSPATMSDVSDCEVSKHFEASRNADTKKYHLYVRAKPMQYEQVTGWICPPSSIICKETSLRKDFKIPLGSYCTDAGWTWLPRKKQGRRCMPFDYEDGQGFGGKQVFHLLIKATDDNAVSKDPSHDFTNQLDAADGTFSVVRRFKVDIHDEGEAPEWYGYTMEFSCDAKWLPGNEVTVGRPLKLLASDSKGSERLRFTFGLAVTGKRYPGSLPFNLTTDGVLTVGGGAMWQPPSESGTAGSYCGSDLAGDDIDVNGQLSRPDGCTPQHSQLTDCWGAYEAYTDLSSTNVPKDIVPMSGNARSPDFGSYLLPYQQYDETSKLMAERGNACVGDITCEEKGNVRRPFVFMVIATNDGGKSTEAAITLVAAKSANRPVFPDFYRDHDERPSWYIDSLANLGPKSQAIYEITIPENEYGFAVSTNNCQFTKGFLPTTVGCPAAPVAWDGDGHSLPSDYDECCQLIWAEDQDLQTGGELSYEMGEVSKASPSLVEADNSISVLVIGTHKTSGNVDRSGGGAHVGKTQGAATFTLDPNRILDYEMTDFDGSSHSGRFKFILAVTDKYPGNYVTHEVIIHVIDNNDAPCARLGRGTDGNLRGVCPEKTGRLAETAGLNDFVEWTCDTTKSADEQLCGWFDDDDAMDNFPSLKHSSVVYEIPDDLNAHKVSTAADAQSTKDVFADPEQISDTDTAIPSYRAAPSDPDNQVLTNTGTNRGFRLKVKADRPTNGNLFDHELREYVTLTVRVYDDKENDDLSYGEGSVKIQILDNNEPPVLNPAACCADDFPVARSRPASTNFTLQEVDSIHFFGISYACEKVGYVWLGTEQKCGPEEVCCVAADEGAPVAAVRHEDPDHSKLTYEITAVQALSKRTGNFVDMNITLFRLADNCKADKGVDSAVGETCEVYRTTDLKELHFFDYEKYTEFDITIKGKELDATCLEHRFERRCERHGRSLECGMSDVRSGNSSYRRG